MTNISKALQPTTWHQVRVPLSCQLPILSPLICYLILWLR